VSATAGTLNYAAYTTPVAINATTSSATGITGTFSGITTFTGGTGSNSFIDTAGSNTWNISSNNTGNVAGFNFNSFDTLVGGIADTFAFGNNAAISGNLTGGGNATLNVSELSSPTIDVTAHTSTGIGGTFSGITYFIGSGTDSTLAGLSDTTISGIDTGSSGGNTFTAFGNLIGAGNNTFTFNSNARITGNLTDTSGINTYILSNNSSIGGNLTGSGNDTLDISALPTSSVNLTTAKSTGINGTFSGIIKFNGSGTNSSLTGPVNNNIWTINSTNGGNVGNYLFTGFNNLIGGAGDNDFILSGNGNVSGSITGGNGNNTLTAANKTTNWTINNANEGSVTGVTGGFFNIQNLTGGTGTNTFNFTGNGSISGIINGGNTTNMNTINYSGDAESVMMTLAIPVSGNELNSGSIKNNASTTISSFIQIQQVIGSSLALDDLILPNKPNISITYTDASHTAGFIGDPFFFNNFSLENVPVQPVPPTPIPLNVAQVIAPFTQPSAATMPPVIVLPQDNPINEDIIQISQQQISLDNQITKTLTVGCFQTQ